MPIRSVLSRRHRRGLGTRVAVLRRDASRRRFRRSGAVATVVIAAASLAVVSPPATEPAAAQVVPLDATCFQLNAIVGRPTQTYIVREGIQFVSGSETGVGPGSDNRYSNGETIRIEVTLSLNVSFGVRDDLDPNVEPLSMNVMLGDTEVRANATPAEGEGTNLLTFEYTLDSDDGTHRAGDLWIPENSVNADDYALAKSASNVAHQFISGPCGGAALEHPAVFHPQTPGSPTVVRRPKIMSEPIDGHTYYAGEKIWVRVEYSEPVTVTGTPVLKLRFGDATDANPAYKDARYVSDSTSDPPNEDPRRRSSMTRLLFEYEVHSTDSDPDGISIDWGSLSGGTISAMDNGVRATLNHDELEAQADLRAVDRDMDGEVDGGDPTVAKHFVDGSRGPLTSQELQDPSNPAFVASYTTRVVSESATGTTLHEGEYVVVRADFNEAVFVDDTRLELPIQIFNCHKDDFRHRDQLSGTDLDSYDTGLVELGCLDNLQDRNRVNPTLKYAKYFSGSGHTRLLFYYEVTNDDQDRDGIIVPNGRFTYDGGQPIDENNQNIFRAADGGHLYTHYSDVFEKPLKYQRVDGKAVEGPPIIEALEVTSMPLSGESDPPDTYGFGETIQVKVTFNQAVRVAGSPKLTLNLQSGPKDAAYDSGDDSKLLFFHYAVEAGDLDGNGISIDADSLKSNDITNGTIIADDDGEDAPLDHRALGTQGGHRVDAMAPTITRLSISSDPPNGGTYYGVGSYIDIKVTYDDPVTVTGNPSLEIDFGSSTQPDPRTADFNQQASNEDNNNRTIVFRYNVFSPDNDPDGLRVPAGSINRGTIQSTSQNPIPADRDFDELRAQSGHKVETDPPGIDSVQITSRGTGTDGKYLVDSTISVTLTFDEIVYVDDTNGTPYLPINIGSGIPVQADYASGSGSSNRKLVFSYTVEEPGLEDTDGIAVTDNTLTFNGGKITDQAGNEAEPDHDGIDAPNTHTVDSIVPTIENLEVRITSMPPNSGDTYGLENTITFEVEFSEDVVVSGTPQLRFQIGDDQTNPARNDRRASARATDLSAGCEEDDDDPCTLTFSYTVGSNDDDNDGISVELATDPGSAMTGGTIKDLTGNRANLNHNEIRDQPSHKVDASPPSAGIVDIIGTGPQYLNTYRIDDVITIEVTFDDPIVLTLVDGDNDGDTQDPDDAPYIGLTIGSTPKLAYYTSHRSDTLVFEYTVVEGDFDTNGISVRASSLRLQSATLKDQQGNTAMLNNPAVNNDPEHKVDGVKPRITSGPRIGSSPPRNGSPYSNDKYGVYSTWNEVPIVVEVTFSENVLISTSNCFSVTIGTSPVTACWVEPDGYDSAEGVRTASFEYQVAASDEDTDGISIELATDETTAITGTITDRFLNDADLTHGALSTQTRHKVETTAPTVTGMEITSPSPPNDTYHLADDIMLTVTFSEPVVVVGDPMLGLNIGGTNELASFQSTHRHEQ